MNPRVFRGRPLPLGSSLIGDSVNFALLCKHGTSVRLVLQPIDTEQATEIDLHPLRNRTGDHWHVRLEGLPPQFRFGWRVDGPRGANHRFDPSTILIDPAAVMLSD